MSIRKLIVWAALAFLIIQLNIYFAWTSRVGMAQNFHQVSALRSFLVSEVNSITKLQLSIPGIANYFLTLTSNTRTLGPRSMLEMKLFIDCEVIAFTLATFVISLFLFRSRGLGLSILRALEITSAAILPLGIEIYLYDRGQFNIHASDIQTKIGLAWFTNADVLYVSTAVFVSTILIEAIYRSKERKVKNKPPPMAELSRTRLA
jgi:hypothetical protein